MSTKPKDMKEGLSSARKADITHVRVPFMVYTARPCEYGSAKYERANFMRAVSTTPGVPTKADFERFRSYLRAGMSHIAETLQAMELHQANDPQLEDIEGMKRAAYAVDTDVTPGSKVGASMLPHISPACASLNMAVTQATMCGLLPADPGQPWVKPTAADRRLEMEMAGAALADILAEVRVGNGAYDFVEPVIKGGYDVSPPVQGGLAADLTPGESDLLADAAMDAARAVRHYALNDFCPNRVGEY